nr:ADP-ribose glycohydrolase MACROD1 isoform X4 [Nothobranchius furzeri]
MAFQISASHIRAVSCMSSSMPCVRSDFQRAGVKFKHFFTLGGSPQFGRTPVASPARGEVDAAIRAHRFSTTTAAGAPRKFVQANGSSLPRGRSGWLGKFALGAALGASTAALVQSFHTGVITAMSHKINLGSAEGDWKETKAFLLSLSLEDRRPYYRTSGSVSLVDIPVWTPTAANKTLLGGGGVDGAIHRAAGPLLKKECASLNGCETGEAKITCGYGLPAKYVIHTVGPIAQGGVGEQQRRALKSCYKNSLEAATSNAARSVAFPCVSTGIYGYPPEQAVHEALAAVREFLDAHHDKLDRVIFCVFLPMDKELYLQNLPLYFPAETTVRSKL